MIESWFQSIYGQGNNARCLFLTANMDASTWGDELALGEGKGRIYLVNSTGLIEEDPEMTDSKFPGNPGKSYH